MAGVIVVPMGFSRANVHNVSLFSCMRRWIREAENFLPERKHCSESWVGIERVVEAVWERLRGNQLRRRPRILLDGRWAMLLKLVQHQQQKWMSQLLNKVCRGEFRRDRGWFFVYYDDEGLKHATQSLLGNPTRWIAKNDWEECA